MSEVRKLPATRFGGRVETGPVQFGDDQPGVFIRGDDACTAYFDLKTLADIMKSCDMRVLCSCPPDRELDASESCYYREHPCSIHVATPPCDDSLCWRTPEGVFHGWTCPKCQSVDGEYPPSTLKESP